jgi:CTP synthase
VNVEYVNALDINDDTAVNMLSGFDGIVVPGGFGGRGIEGKIAAIRYARESKTPFLGICLGMQLASIEFARNVLSYGDANSIEFDPTAEHCVIHLMEEQKGIKNKGGTMRLGGYPCDLKKDTKAHIAYGRTQINERHRHRYEFNNHYRDVFEGNGMVFSGLSPDEKLVELVELRDHPWFVGCQFHPELKSKPTKSHPLFRDFVKQSLENKRGSECE